jgi:hypothetical protein
MITVASGSLRCCGLVNYHGQEIGCLKWGWFIHEGKRYCYQHHPVLRGTDKKPSKKSAELQSTEA